MPHSGQPLDHGGDAVKGPQLPGKPVAASTPQQGLFDPAELDVGEPGCWSGRASATQAVSTGGLPALMPQVHALAGNVEPAGDLGLADAGDEQLPSAQPAGLEPIAFVLCREAASWLA
jgi:hypothetical protein